MKASEIMSDGVLTITPETLVPQIARLMIEHRITGLPVVSPSGTLVGIVTEGDLLRRRDLGTAKRRRRLAEFFTSDATIENEYVRAHATKASDLMSTELVEVGPDTPVSRIVDLFERHNIKRVPVVVDGKPVGIVSRRDLIRALASAAGEPEETTADDSALRARLLDELSHQRWWRHDRRNVVVRSGIVHLWGLIASPTELAALRVAAENVPGVRAVRDHTVMSLAPFGL